MVDVITFNIQHLPCTHKYQYQVSLRASLKPKPISHSQYRIAVGEWVWV